VSFLVNHLLGAAAMTMKFFSDISWAWNTCSNLQFSQFFSVSNSFAATYFIAIFVVFGALPGCWRRLNFYLIFGNRRGERGKGREKGKGYLL